MKIGGKNKSVAFIILVSVFYCNGVNSNSKDFHNYVDMILRHWHL